MTEPTLDVLCNWCDKPSVLHSAFEKRWHSFFCQITRQPSSYETEPVWTRTQPIAMHPTSLTAHVNRQRFEGILCIVDSVSDKAPSGARGHCIASSSPGMPRSKPCTR